MTDKKMISNPTGSAQSKMVEILTARKARDNASLITNSAVPATAIVSNYGGSTTEPKDVLARLHEQADAVLDGDMSQPETMLFHQAVALQSIFVDLALMAKKQSSFSEMQAMIQLALKAQSNCRATLQTLADIKNPKQVAFFKQANIAQNQQINNRTASASREEIAVSKPIELLVEESHGSQKLDPRTKRKAGRPRPLSVGGDMDVALQLAQSAKASAPDEPSVNHTLGWVYLQRNLPALAIPLLKFCVDSDAKNGTYQYLQRTNQL